MSGESTCMCGRDLALICRACDVDPCDECLQLPKARARIAELETDRDNLARELDALRARLAGGE